jgi:hypothetical protein
VSVLYAELVAFRIGHHYPGLVAALPNVDAGSSQPFQAGNLCGLILRSQVKMQPILARLGLRHLDEQQVGHHAVFATTFGWLDDPLRIFGLADHPTQCLCPEPGQSPGILRIDDQGTDAQSHGITVGHSTTGAGSKHAQSTWGEQPNGVTRVHDGACPQADPVEVAFA